MPYYNPFADDWRESLRAHYLHVIRVQDVGTERTLTKILQRLSFSDTELAELRVIATMRTEDMGEDYVPDFAAVEALIAAEVEAGQQQAEAETSAPPEHAHEAPLFPAFAMPDTAPPIADSVPADAADDTLAAPEPQSEPVAPPSDEYYAPADERPQQLSLF